ncbi:hypothetical protein QBC46DRAFT_442725 [Diplogelasinospora grovesii]|uniref:Uncharacterized protein n=1 Tax=Diplogelasinospora grovesii TaxID=303347 RepID=A0AAN6N4Q8_9PEZI|nr:hypothetical protein QBC46DRAFT_442725 [Diplogelasinospora grovesii]
MRLQDAFFALVTATAAAAPAPQLEEKIKSYLIPRDGVPQTVDIPTMDVNWTRFDDKPVETMPPAEADGSDTVKRGRRNKVDLKNSTTLTWKSDHATAKLRADYDGDDEHVMELDDFSDEVKRLDCTPPRMRLKFESRSTYTDAKTKWSWVNKKDANHIVLITNDARCGAANQRNTYNITNIEFDDDKDAIILRAVQVEFKQAVHDGHFRVEIMAQVPTGGDLPPPTNLTNPGSNNPGNGSMGITRRDHSGLGVLEDRARLSKGGSIYKQWKGPIVSAGGATLSCYDCGTYGYLQVAFDASISWFSLSHAYFEFSATNVAAWMDLQLSGQTAGAGIRGHKELFAWTIAGISIPGIAKLGFGPEFGVGWSANVKGGGTVWFGGSAVLTPNSYYKVCFKGCSSVANGWGISLYRWGPWVSGNMHAALDVFSYTALSAGARFLTWGWEVGVAAKAPELTATFDTTLGSSNVCNNPAYHNGLQANINVGADVYLYTGSNPVTPSKKWSWWTTSFNLFKACIGWA